MTPIDDLKPGDFIAVVEDKRDLPDCYSRGMFTFNGLPLEVLAISLPFLAVNDGCTTTSLDVRQWGVRKVNRQYVKAMQDASPDLVLPRGRKRRKVRKTKPDPKDCPRCGSRMVEKLDKPTSAWFLTCRMCGFQGLEAVRG